MTEAVLLVAEKALEQSRQAVEISNEKSKESADLFKTLSEIVDPLLKRIEQLEARQPERGEKGEQGPAGRDADPIDVKEVVAELFSGDELGTLVNLHVAEAVQKYFEANPVRNGKDADPGKNGKDASDEQVEKAVAAYLKANPPAKGKDGDDGVGLASATIDRDGNLILTTTKGATVNLGKVVGERGKDGADFTDVAIDYDGERTITIRGKGGEIVKRMPIPMDKGYWRDGLDCEKADIVTHNGNAWIALRDTKTKPCLENKDDWRLFARKGRDGTDNPPRKPGPPQPVKLNGNA